MKLIRYCLLVVLTALLVVTVAAQPGLAQEQVTCERDVIVQAGDWLSTIAAQVYGNPTQYEAIVTATNQMAQTDSSYATITDPNVIEAGWKLCMPAQSDAATSAPSAETGTGTLTPEQLANATYSGIYEDPVTLTEGLYEGEPYVAGDTSRPTVQYENNAELYGDLDGDGEEDAVVFLVENSGGTGNFVYVAAQLNRGGVPVDAGAVWLEDRIQVKSVAIDNGQINLEITAEGPGDAACCKTHLTRKSYALQNGVLAELPGEEIPLERVSAANLDGTSWTLYELSETQPVLADTEITISFAGDQLSGSAGCNSFTGSFTLAEDNPFIMTIGPLAVTQMACPEPIMSQESAFLAALQNVAQWGYRYGDFALAYPGEEPGYRQMLFATPAAETAAAESSQLDTLTGTPWQWVSFTDPVQQFEVEQPENYTLDFQAGGTLAIKADCSQVIATYSASEEGALSVQTGPATLAACPLESRGDAFVQNLGFAANYFFQDGSLFIDMMADGGTLKFNSIAP